RNSIEHAQLAIGAGVDLVNIYGPYGLHGYRPTDQEYLRYFDRILAEISHPVSLCPHASLGYSPKPTVLAAIADKYPQVRTIILSGITGDAYLVELLDAVHRDIEIIVRYDGAFNTLGLGAHGIDVQEANFVPATVRHYIDAYQDGRFSAALESYAALKRLTKINERWRPSSARWIKMALKVFRLPGGDGGVREPYLMPDRAERELFTTSVLALGIPEIDEMARAAGLA
ncbi:MAG TPA: dihydrodipicolinate synthase family protein, partial [Micromonosporaceae bacterium]